MYITLARVKHICSRLAADYRVFFVRFLANNSSKPLGLSNRSKINDNQIRSSVSTPVDCGSHAARLNDEGYWCATEEGDYIQIDFGRRALVTEIWSQGAGEEEYWTRNFTVVMSNDGVNFVDYEEYGARKV